MSETTWSIDEDCPPLTEDEYEAVVEEFDDFLVGGTHADPYLHLHECRQLSRSISEQITPKPTSVYPYGFYDVCLFCRYNWRHGLIEDE